MGSHRPLAALLLTYWLLAFGLYGVWEWQGWYPITGDEPHHIIIGRSILHHGSLEQTRAYEDEFARGYLGKPGDAVTRFNAHVVQGPRGRFSIHSPGTGIMAVLPIALSELLGYPNDVVFVKTFFVLLSGLAVIAAWMLATLFIQSMAARVLAVVLTCFGLPLMIAANQVFPDLPAGLIGVCVLSWLAWRSHRIVSSLWQDVTAMCLIACLPWLHYKLSIMAVVLGLAVLITTLASGAGWKRIRAMCIVPALAAAAFFAYNYYAFDRLVPFHQSTSVHADSRALMWFFALHLDRWHGLLLQNPTFLIGFLFLVPFLIRQPRLGIPAFLAYLAVTGINAANGGPGYSFAGRFAWTGCLCLIPATIYGIGCLERLSERVWFVTAAALLSLQVVFLVPLLASKNDLYNPYGTVWFDVYPSFFPSAVNRFLPAFYDVWWPQHPTNYVFILLVFLLIGIGAWSYAGRHRQSVRPIGALLSLWIPVALLAGLFQADPPRKPLVFTAGSLFRQFGILQGDAILASVAADNAGIWTFGPYIRLGKGNYRVSFELQSQAPPAVKVGSWDVTGRAGRVRLGSGDIMGTAGARGEAGGLFQITSRGDGDALEARMFFEDTADVLFVKVVIKPAD